MTRVRALRRGAVGGIGEQLVVELVAPLGEGPVPQLEVTNSVIVTDVDTLGERVSCDGSPGSCRATATLAGQGTIDPSSRRAVR